MYRFANQKEVKDGAKFCEIILKELQRELKDYFTFQFTLIGSGGKKLVTQNENGPFDLDYNLVIQKDKKDFINNPKKVKQLFIDAFNYILPNKISGYKYASDSTSVITLKKIEYRKLVFSFDCAIMVECDNGFTYKLVNDKHNGNNYIWNQVPKSKDYEYKLQLIKENNLWKKFKNRYLELKNYHLKRNDNVASFSVFLETLNEFK